MKRILITLLLLVSFLVNAKVTIEKAKINNIWYKIYRPSVPTNKWVISLHGIGEKGSPDGSELDRIERNGYPQKAKAGFEFPFNIIAPQIPTTKNADYWMLIGQPGTTTEGWFVNFVKETLGASEIIVTGISLGGRGAWTLLRYDVKKYIKAIAPVCGFYNSLEGPVCNLRSVPGYSWHHQKDMVMNYGWDKGAIDAYNGCKNTVRPNQIIDGVVRPCHYLNTLTQDTPYPHNAWTIAYDVRAGKDGLLKWILQNFSNEVNP